MFIPLQGGPENHRPGSYRKLVSNIERPASVFGQSTVEATGLITHNEHTHDSCIWKPLTTLFIYQHIQSSKQSHERHHHQPPSGDGHIVLGGGDLPYLSGSGSGVCAVDLALHCTDMCFHYSGFRHSLLRKRKHTV